MNPQFKQDAEFWEAGWDATAPFASALNASTKDDLAVRVLGFFLDRASSIASALMTLSQHHPDDYGYEASILLRSLYDVSLQATWLTWNPQESLALAGDYWDFYEIERNRFIEKVDKSQTEYAKMLAVSPKRAVNEKDIKHAYGLARQKFAGRRGGVCENWYRKNLRQIAADMGLAEEHDFIVIGLSSAVHASPAAYRNGPAIEREHVIVMAFNCLLRVMRSTARYHGLKLEPELQEILDDAAGNTITEASKHLAAMKALAKTGAHEP